MPTSPRQSWAHGNSTGSDAKSTSRSRSFALAPAPTNLALLIRIPSSSSDDPRVIHLPTRTLNNAQPADTRAGTPPKSSKRWNFLGTKSTKIADNPQRVEAEMLDPDNSAW
ncbi:hypothetical protein FB451DRAFT_1390079 [Mycena latifolia]|nr:hypothetical protein FB451DRAFT_1390079 [Mycena latifolia]